MSINDSNLDTSLDDLRERMRAQDSRISDHLFAFNRNGLRLAIAAIEDETSELYDEWRNHKRMLGNAHKEIQNELLDIAAVAMLTYLETIDQ